MNHFQRDGMKAGRRPVQRCKCPRIKISVIILGCLLVGCLLFPRPPIAAYAQGQQYSSYFRMLLSAVNQLYLRPNGYSAPQYAKQYPGNLAVMMGHALRRQLKAIQEDPVFVRRFEGLADETKDYLNRLAWTLGYRFPDGRKMRQDKLWFYALEAMNGKYDNKVYQYFGVAPHHVPAMVLQPPEQVERRLRGKLQGEMAVELLRVVASKVKSPGFGKDPQAAKFPPETLIGRWAMRENILTFRPGRNRGEYVGRYTRHEGSRKEAKDPCHFSRITYVLRFDAYKKNPLTKETINYYTGRSYFGRGSTCYSHDKEWNIYLVKRKGDYVISNEPMFGYFSMRKIK